MQDVVSWNRDRARDVLGPGVRVAVAATEGGRPPTDAPLGGIERISWAAALLAALFDVLRRRREVQQRYLALTEDSLILCDTALVSGRDALRTGR